MAKDTGQLSSSSIFQWERVRSFKPHAKVGTGNRTDIRLEAISMPQICPGPSLGVSENMVLPLQRDLQYLEMGNCNPTHQASRVYTLIAPAHQHWSHSY